MTQSISDFRPLSSNDPVWRLDLDQYSIPDATPAAVSKNFPVNGILRQWTAVISAHASATYTVTIKDSGGFTLYSLGSLGGSGITTTTTTLTADTEVYIPRGSTVEVLVSVDPNSAETVDLTFIGK